MSKELTEKAKLTLKPHLTNALLPLFLKNLVYSAGITITLLLIAFVLELFNIIQINNKIPWSIAIIIILSTISVIYKWTTLMSINYHFYKTHIIKEFKLLYIKREYVPYSQIANITIDISLWDRICSAGDIKIHTSDDSVDITLKYIENPEKVEKKIYALVNKAKSSKKKQ